MYIETPIYIYIYIRGVMIPIKENGDGILSSEPGQGCTFPFSSRGILL